jgi:CRISPR-associated protein Cas1
MLDGSGSLSFDVVSWLSDQAVPLIRLDYQGEIASVIGGSGFAMCADKVRWQIETRDDPDKRLAFSCDLIRQKLEGSLRTLQAAIPAKAAAPAISRTEAALVKVCGGSVASIDELRMIEAVAAGAYFAAWQGLQLEWRSRRRHPIPDAWLTINGRNSVGSGRSLSNRNAKHPLNAVLNYAYGLLYSQVQIEMVAEGFDPRRGIMHHDRKDADALAFVFDMIEPRRADIDAKVLKFMLSSVFTGADFAIRSDGVCRLAPQLARRICQVVTN